MPFYKSWSVESALLRAVESALLRAESKIENVIGLLVERKVLNCLSKQFFGSYFVIAFWSSGDKMNKLTGLGGQGSESSGGKNFKTKKIKK